MLGSQALEELAEAQAAVERSQGLVVLDTEGEGFGSTLQRNVLAKRGQKLGESRLLRLAEQRLPRLLGLDLPGVLEKGLEISPLRDQASGPLLTDSPDARDVVAGVAGEGSRVEQQLRRHAEARLDLGRADPGSLHGVEEEDALVDQLHQILVRGDDRHLGFRRRLLHQGGDHVIGLEAGNLEDGNPVSVHQLPGDRELGREVFRLCVPIRLVLRIELVAEAAAGGIEDDCHGVGLLLPDHLGEHLREAEDGVGGKPVRSSQGRKSEEGAIQTVRRVDDDESSRKLARVVHRPNPRLRQEAQAGSLSQRRGVYRGGAESIAAAGREAGPPDR